MTLIESLRLEERVRVMGWNRHGGYVSAKRRHFSVGRGGWYSTGEG